MSKFRFNFLKLYFSSPRTLGKLELYLGKVDLTKKIYITKFISLNLNLNIGINVASNFT